jgi:hypothetical protein
MPDNAFYYHVAYVALTVLYTGYTLSIFVRRSALARRRDRQMGGRS